MADSPGSCCPRLHATAGVVGVFVGLCLLALPPARADEILFEHGFEGAMSYEELFPLDYSGWTNERHTHDANRMTVVAAAGRNGTQALRIEAVSDASPVSKASVVWQGFDLREGDTATFEAWYFVESQGSLADLFLMDIECTDCWPAGSPLSNKSPGVRLSLKEREGFVAVDRGKLGYRDAPFRPGSVGWHPFPRGRWVHLRWTMHLSVADDGWSKIWLDDVLVLDARGTTLPDRDEFRKWGLELDKVRYDYIEVGVTANPGGDAVTIRLDDVRVTRHDR